MELTLVGRDGDEGARFTLPNGEVMIGRRPDCHIVLDAPSISPRHARIFCIDGHAVLYAVDGKWPVYVNGHAVNRRVLVDADEIELGHYRLRCTEAGREPEVEALPPLVEPAVEEPSAAEPPRAAGPSPPAGDRASSGTGDEAPAPPRRFHLDILSGINQGRRVALTHDRVVLGFNQQRLVELHNTGEALSLRRISDEADVRFNGEPLADEPAETKPGDMVSLQRIALRIGCRMG